MRFLGIVALLLAVNWITVALFAPGKEKTITIPFSPMFEQQVTREQRRPGLHAGRGDRRPVQEAGHVPAQGPEGLGDRENFETQIPTFAANTDARLRRCCEDHDVSDRGRADQRRAAGRC